jgi:hypothetical protein
MTELTELRAYKARREDLDGLQAKAVELGFTGSVADLMPVGTEMATSMSGLITAFRDEVATRIETFKTEDSAETDLGDSGPDETATPTSMTAALNYVRTTYNLTGKPAVEKAREMYPTIFGGK